MAYDESDDDNRNKAGLISFGKDIRKLLSPILGKSGFLQADILSHWDDILGHTLSQGIKPASISFSKRNEGHHTVLNVQAISGAFATEFNAHKEQIRKRLNSYFGYEAISEIKVKQGFNHLFQPKPKPIQKQLSPTEQAEISELSSTIQDENLRQTIEELGTLIKMQNKD